MLSAVKSTVGNCCCDPTVTVTEATAGVVPLAPEQVIVYVFVLVKEPVLWLFGYVLLLPDQAPLAVQEVALAGVQRRIVDSP
ncbi:MAG: hypothetical protein UW02_C0006G0001 [Candidatus Nomurabacteria bacterium GW2011_GWB1_43_7]|uniref:Uncharacterized protein n=1 Tax=Candidatus Nomurabacteria bacterium GW2011_GWB1_43_7 TaxID=1618747 RepID=A0A0G1FBP0_9BACT|nr:MAG: hypothetical protein UW02_C0006G0001 [Candidatus Nomurabacteria bacterium GW2011_GWB1_43_7]